MNRKLLVQCSVVGFKIWSDSGPPRTWLMTPALVYIYQCTFPVEHITWVNYFSGPAAQKKCNTPVLPLKLGIFVDGRHHRWKSLLKSKPQIFVPRTVCPPASSKLFLDNVHTRNKQMEMKIKDTKRLLVELRCAHQNVKIFPISSWLHFHKSKSTSTQFI